jgi:hypothetical protein
MKFDDGLKSTFIWLTLFGLAVGFLESAVVVYLRELYYPLGFSFPLSSMKASIALTEILRELSTLIILFSIAGLAGHNRKQRVAWFFYIFAIWDLFYYVFLKVLIDWPETLFTWDILFLIPTTWTGPVITPILVSITMILLTALLLWMDQEAHSITIGWGLKLNLLLGSGLVFLSFIWDYSSYMLNRLTLSELGDTQKVEQALQHYIPDQFNWWMFMAGLLTVYYGLYKMFSMIKTLR